MRSLISSILLLCSCSAKVAGPPQPPHWNDDFKLVEPIDKNPAPDVVEIDLVASVSTVNLNGTPTSMWTYNGQVPGPLIRSKVGDTVIIHFKNQLPSPTTIHWHGVKVPAAMDGTDVSQGGIAPSGTFEYRFTTTEAGLFWYHPHLRSSAQVGYGLYGAIEVVDSKQPFWGDEVVMVLSDASTVDAGVLAPGDENGWFGDYFGREGNLLLVNGKVMPTLKARAGLPQRWKLVNASRARYYALDIPQADVVRIGGDVGLLETAQKGTGVVLTPGERAELWVRPSQPNARQTIQWVDADRFHLNMPLPRLPLFYWDVNDEAPYAEARVPMGALQPLMPSAPDVTVAKPRKFELMDIVDGGTGYLGINGQVYSDSTPITVRLGDIENWEVSNSTSYDHSFHLHGYAFLPLDLDGKAWPLKEWKDSINVPAKSKLHLLVRFDDRPGMWMLHCHILDHVELGMMLMLHVMP